MIYGLLDAPEYCLSKTGHQLMYTHDRQMFLLPLDTTEPGDHFDICFVLYDRGRPGQGAR